LFSAISDRFVPIRELSVEPAPLANTGAEQTRRAFAFLFALPLRPAERARFFCLCPRSLMARL
jgi:hypothetical protein